MKMINTYREYLTMPQTLTLEQMNAIHEEMVSEINSAPHSETMEIYEELLEKAVQYCSFRSKWFRWDREERIKHDSSRTSCHNSLITHFNMLARFLKNQGQSAKWRDTLGYEEDHPDNRKRIGDFACFLVFAESLNAR